MLHENNNKPTIYDYCKDFAIPVISVLIALVVAIVQIISWCGDREKIVRPKSGWLPKIIQVDAEQQEFDLEIVNVGKTDVTYRLELSSSFIDFVSDIKYQEPTPFKFQSYRIFLGSQQTKLNSYTHHVKLDNMSMRVPDKYNSMHSNAYIELMIFEENESGKKSNKKLYHSKCYYNLENGEFIGGGRVATLNRPYIDTTGNSQKQNAECKSL